MDLLFIPLTIGLPAIDESLEKLLTAMETFPNVTVLGDACLLYTSCGADYHGRVPAEDAYQKGTEGSYH